MIDINWREFFKEAGIVYGGALVGTALCMVVTTLIALALVAA